MIVPVSLAHVPGRYRKPWLTVAWMGAGVLSGKTGLGRLELHIADARHLMAMRDGLDFMAGYGADLCAKDIRDSLQMDASIADATYHAKAVGVVIID